MGRYLYCSLYHYFEKIGNRLGLTFWTVMSLPLVLYLIGKAPDILICHQIIHTGFTLESCLE